MEQIANFLLLLVPKYCDISGSILFPYTKLSICVCKKRIWLSLFQIKNWYIRGVIALRPYYFKNATYHYNM